MDVVRTVDVSESSVHFSDVEFAVGDGRVTVAAGVAGIVRMGYMAGKAAQSFVNTRGRAVVFRAGLVLEIG